MASEQLAGSLEHIRVSIAKLNEKVRSLKKAANALASAEDCPPVYEDVDDGDSATGTYGLRSDQFSALPSPSTAARAYLELRGKQRGSTTIDDIFDALKRGGYAFEGTDGEAKGGLRIALGKDNQIAKLPNATYGLNAWYGDRFTAKKSKGGEATAQTSVVQPNGAADKESTDEKE